MAAVGMVFAPLAPLVVLAAAIVFWMNSWVYKYQLMFVYVTKVESGGVCVLLLGHLIHANFFITIAYLERDHQPLVGLRHSHATTHASQ